MWTNAVTTLYPDALVRTYCVSPLHFNRVPYRRVRVPGTCLPALEARPPSSDARTKFQHQKVRQCKKACRLPSIPQGMWTPEQDIKSDPFNVQEDDVIDDQSQYFVVEHLKVLGEQRQEPMFVLSQMQFDNYLNKKDFAHVVAAANLPKPRDLQKSYHRGDFDVLIIHLHHGILIGEIKSVGSKPESCADAVVAKKVLTAVGQLVKGEAVFSHLVSDVAPGLPIKKTIILPFIESEQLKRILRNDGQLEQTLRHCVGGSNPSDVVQVCVCADQFSDRSSPWQVTTASLSQLTTWWTQRMDTASTNSALTEQLYLEIVARFVGPATTVSVHCSVSPRVSVEVRTEGEAVAELGKRLSRLVLTPDQLDLLNRNPPFVCVSGPPGTGKTLVLVLQALRCLRGGDDVYLVSSRPASLAACLMAQNQLKMTLNSEASSDPAGAGSQRVGSVHLKRYNFYKSEEDVDKAISDLLSAAQAARGSNRQICVIMDDAVFDNVLLSGPRSQRFVRELSARCGDSLCLWAACVAYNDIPQQLVIEKLTAPMRCAPVILREVEKGLNGTFTIYDYNDNHVPAPGDGLRVVWLLHQGDGHSGQWPVGCPKCGHHVADQLRRFGVGHSKDGSPLSWRDVFVVTRSSDLDDDVIDETGRVTSPACGFVQGLKDEKVPLCVIGMESGSHDYVKWKNDVSDMALAVTDRVMVVYANMVSGLERRVVVWLPGRDEGRDDHATENYISTWDRVNILSRCTTQLIAVTVPAGPDAQGNG